MTLPHRGSGRDWRTALSKLDPATAQAPITLQAAQLLLARGLYADAEAAYRDFLARFPDHAPGLRALAMFLRRYGRDGEAAGLLARAVRIEVARLDLPEAERPAVEQFMLAAERCGPPPTASPAGFVANLFDTNADQFEPLLRGSLRYRAPELLSAAVARLVGATPLGLDVLDLGCGTGLAGEVFRPVARRLDGVDLSQGMLDQAAAKGVYDRLVAADLVAYLDQAEHSYELVVAADVFVYLGDLAPVFAACRRVLRAGGLLAFTVEAGEEPGFHLRPTRRYAHHRDYLTRTADDAGFDVCSLHETWTRFDALHPVASYVCVLSPDVSVKSGDKK
jgi:predicted TPR repeat methyltransferase